MIERQKWVDHEFNLGIHVGWKKNVLSRVQDAGIRIAHHCYNLSDEQLSASINEAWSIKQHIGHLIDLEAIHTQRLQEFASFKRILTMADMSNAKTNQADHNDQTLFTLLEQFERERKQFIEVFESLSDGVQKHKALHPRIKVLMRPIDLLFFVAEHDDHHIVSMNRLKSMV